MTVAELIEILQTIENPEKKTIIVQDTAAGNRKIDYVEDTLYPGIMSCVIRTKK
ncbi:hypothetical protein [Bacillus wiedmannii]|uniref:hypothetical protein n=1 Tax=Bacillus wiedmannii TaxID=1890302 RepID=UPI000ABC1790|nr:hypothetical protein [Bacillus wiedmannii]